MTDNLESNSDKLSIDQKEELSSSRPLCYWNDAVSENCKNEGMYNASNINNPCDTPSILNNLKLKNINRLVGPFLEKRNQIVIFKNPDKLHKSS